MARYLITLKYSALPGQLLEKNFRLIFFFGTVFIGNNFRASVCLAVLEMRPETRVARLSVNQGCPTCDPPGCLLQPAIFFFHLLYNPLWLFVFSTRPFQAFLFSARSFQFFTFGTFVPLHSSSSLLVLGLPVRRLPIGFHSNVIFPVLGKPILCVWPKHLILWALTNLAISAPLTF